MLTFDEAAHAYFWDGKPVPNVTRIIAPLTDYSRIPPDKLAEAQRQGKHVHAMVEADCKGTLVDLPEWMVGHFNAWSRFKDETGFECWNSEKRVYHRKMGYAGTLDLEGLLPKYKKSRAPAVLDVKRSFYAGPAIGLQTFGYLDARNTEVPKDQRLQERYALQLRPDGTYRLEPYTDRDDQAAFMACLQQLRWKGKHYGQPAA